jgi:DNA topoisomerase-1
MTFIAESGASSAVSGVALGGSRIDRKNGLHRVDGGTAWIDDKGLPVAEEQTQVRLTELAIPPAWVHVWASSNPDDKVQATGVDSRGRTQYRYAASATMFAAGLKYAHMIAFAEALPSLRSQVAADLRKRHDATGYLPVNQVIAGIVRLLDRGLFRVGNARYARDNHTYGLTTIRREHLTVRGNEVTFDFIGKEHLRHHVTVVDRDASRIVAALLAQPGRPDAELFVAAGSGAAHSIHSTEVNAYLHHHSSAPATAKVFRTWGATAAAAAVVAGAETPANSGRTVEARAVKAAAELLGDTPAVTRSSYVHPAAFDAGRAHSVIKAVNDAANRLRRSDVHTLFVDPGVQAAVLDALRVTANQLVTDTTRSNE